MLFILRLFLYSSSDSRTKNSHDHIPSNIFMPFHMYQFGTKFFEHIYVFNYFIQLREYRKGEFYARYLDWRKIR